MNVLIVGLGSIAAKHIDALKSIDENITIYALRSNANAESVEGIINVYNLDDVNASLDFAIISNPTHLHYEFIDSLVSKGINLFIEKPPLASLDNSENLIKKINDSKVANYVACNLRFHPCIQFLKETFIKNQDKRINEVNIYCGSYLPDWRPGKDFREIYSARPEMGGGVHLDLFHELDYTYWLFGKPIRTNSVLRNTSSLDIPAIDYANYIFEYDNFTANIILNYYRKDAKRIIEIVFEDETWNIDLINNTIYGKDGVKIFSDTTFRVINTYKSQMNYFINTLKVNKEQMNTFAESIEVLKLCLGNE